MKFKINVLLVALLSYFSANAQVENYSVRNIDLGIQYKYPEENAIYRKVIDRLDKSNRVEVIGEANNSVIATHLLEVEPYVSFSDGISVTFVDSIATANIRIYHNSYGKVTMIVTEVQNGLLTGTTQLNTSGASSVNVKAKYSDIGYSKGLKYEGDVKTRIENNIRRLFSRSFRDAETESRAKLVSDFYPDPASRLFPFRMTIKEIAELDGDEAEKVFISGDSKADLSKRDRLTVYTVTEKTSGKRKFEQSDILGRLKYEKDDAKGGFCDVLKGKKKIAQAIKEGKKVYCTPGFGAYTKADESNNAKMAIAINYPKETSQSAKDRLYRRLRMSLASRKGIILLEREKYSKILQEHELQKSDKFIDNQVLEQFKAIGADMVMEINFNHGIDKFNSPSLTYTINLIDVATNQIQGSKTKPTYSFAGSVSDAIEYADVDPIGFLKENLPTLINVIEITEDSKEKAEEVLVVGDFEFSNIGKLDVFRKKMIEVDGEMLPRFEKIGIISRKDSEGDGIMTAKVKEGEKEIYAAMKAGDPLVCMPKAGFFDKLGNSKLLNKVYGF